MEDDKIVMEYLLSLPQQRRRGDNRSLIQRQGFWLLPQLQHGINATIDHFNPLPTDIILASLPKTGTTWLKALLYSIVHHSSLHQLTKDHVQQLVPSLEHQKPESPIGNPSSVNNNLPRIFHTHIPYQLLARTLDSFKGRIVYVTRNPKDTLVSLWHFMNGSKLIGDEPWLIETAVEKFCQGVLPYGPYYKHVLEYKRLSLKRPENVIFLTYEELKSDPKSVVQMLASFLGFPIEREEQVEEIVKVCSFEVLSKYEVNKSEEISNPSSYFPNSSFYRKGEVGDYKNILSQEMTEKIDALTRENFHSSGFMYGI